MTYINNISNALLLMEMPQINDYHSKSMMDELGDERRKILNNSHSSSTKEYDTKVGSVFSQKHNDVKSYYHMVNGNIQEFSDIKNNRQILTSKGTGTPEVIHDMMMYHTKHNGSIKTDKTHTEGAANLWKTLIKSKPIGFKFTHTYDHPSKGYSEPIDASNIDNKRHFIWDTKMDYVNHDITMHRE